MEWIVAPMVLSFYGLSLAFTLLRYFEPKRDAVLVWRIEELQREWRNRPRSLERVDWKKEGF